MRKVLQDFSSVFWLAVITCLFFFFVLMVEVFAQKDLLQSGPMLGYCEMREVKLWVQTNTVADVYFKYYEKENPDIEYFTDEVRTEKEFGYTAHCIADEIMPNRKYIYELYINDEKIIFNYPLEFTSLKDWDWKSEPTELKLAMGSCAFINDSLFDRAGNPYGGEYEIYEAIYNDNPDIMLWLGDNVYYREADWYTKTGIYYRNTQVRSLPEMQPLLASAHNYAIWDDHDYGPNNSNRAFRNKELTRNAFIDFWGNPTYGEDEEGIYTMFNWGDADFFLLDNRWFRSPNNRKTGKREMLGKIQIQWLIDNLVYSKAKFKIIVIGGQVLNPVAKYETYSTFKDELDYLLETIEKENIEGVVFISGDRHFSELTALERDNNYTLYDMTVSPLNSGAYSKGCEENNTLRVEGTCYNERNYGLLEITGKRKDRSLTLTIKNVSGKTIWMKSIHESELKK